MGFANAAGLSSQNNHSRLLLLLNLIADVTRIRHGQCHSEWYLPTIPTAVMPIEFQPESIVEGERFQMTIFKRRDGESVKQEFKEN